MKAKRKAHRQLRIELIYQQKKLVSEAAGEEVKDGTISRSEEKKNISGIPSPKKKRKQKLVITENHSLFCESQVRHLETDKSERNVEDINSEESISSVEEIDYCSEREGKNVMKGLVMDHTKAKEKKKLEKAIFEVKGNQKAKLENGMSSVKSNTEEDNLEVTVTQQDDGRVKHKKKIKKEKLKIKETASQSDEKDDGQDDNLATEADCKTSRKNQKYELKEVALSPIKIKDNSQSIEAKDCDSFSKSNLVESHGISKSAENPNSHWDFEENELMTNYDGYWVLCEDVESLDAAKKIELDALYAARMNVAAGCEKELTQEEQLAFQRAMKKKKRFHHRKLLQKLSKMGEKFGDGEKRKGNKNGKLKRDDSDKVVKFDGFWVKKEAADRLHKLRSECFICQFTII